MVAHVSLLTCAEDRRLAGVAERCVSISSIHLNRILNELLNWKRTALTKILKSDILNKFPCGSAAVQNLNYLDARGSLSSTQPDGLSREEVESYFEGEQEVATNTIRTLPAC